MKIRYLISRQKERQTDRDRQKETDRQRQADRDKQTDRDRLCVKCVCFNLKNEDYKFDIYIER